MKNELLLILSVVLIYGAVLVCYRLFGKSGLYAMTAIGTVLAFLFLHEQFPVKSFVGCALIAAGTLVMVL